MNLPSFLWLWKIAAWSMGLAMFAYGILAVSGISFMVLRHQKSPRPRWLKPLHWIMGVIMVSLIIILMTIGLIGTLGYYGNLGHSIHLPAGIIIAILAIASAWSATQINPKSPWAKTLHVRLNIALFFAFVMVGLSGWTIVQKYLP
ncbi:hypothetical protein Cyast_0499 [Cyanobacterium stanieri PCC 7202]|uniref:DUF4079 domain-containing protein n=1 Tax=Cyanobacterium stanieri (strain ATCC 29140 / PCC 7202) TaxID=292563 RepID=K9YK39_CYASC|nr:hypothetical protein Cyast_0499 [Cyanobacterium stanieri PCC 7202]